jgi:hypothetical protein
MGGTGGIYLARKGEEWQRALLSLVNAHDRGKISDLVVADHLASLNYEAHRAVSDDSVGPRCIVVWRRRPDADGRRIATGGAQQSYTGLDRDRDGDFIPATANGMDLQPMYEVLTKHFLSRISDPAFGSSPMSDIEMAELNQQLAKLPSEPDEGLR